MKCENKGKKGDFGLCLLLVGSMIGAGFITGAEIWQFFAKFGYGSLFGVVVFGCLSYLLVYFEARPKKELNKESLRLERVKKDVNFFSEIMVAAAMISGLKIISKQVKLILYQI